jgi:hypothetical protein
MKTTKGAQVLSVVSFFGCIAMAVPPAFIGVIAKSTGKKNLGFDSHVLYKTTYPHTNLHSPFKVSLRTSGFKL